MLTLQDSIDSPRSPVVKENADSPRTIPIRQISPVHRKGKLGLQVDIDEVLNEGNPLRRKSTNFIESGATCMDKARKYLHGVLKSSQFNAAIGFLITLNTICMGLELDQHDLASPSDTMFSFAAIQGIPRIYFDGFEAFFFTAFGVEYLVRIFVFRSRMLWEIGSYIDFVALAPAVLLLLLGLQSGRQLTLLRIVRLVRLFRLLRIFRLSKELNMLAKSMASAMRALVWIALLLFITVYCSAIVCTTVIGHNPSFSRHDPVVLAYEAETELPVDASRYWGSLARSMLTLFQIFTLDDWNAAVRPVIETHQPWMLFFFIGFIFVTTFGLLNLLMGTIVDRAMHIAKEYEEEKERLVQCEHKQMLLATVRLFSLMDQDGNGIVSAPEIMAFLESNDIQKALEQEMSQFNIKLDYVSLMEICRRIAEEWFDASTDDANGITVEEFAGAASRLHGPAKSQDMLTVLMTSKASLTRVEMCEMGLQRLSEASERQEAKMDKVLDCLQQMHAGSSHQPMRAAFTLPKLDLKKRRPLETECSLATCDFDPESPRHSHEMDLGGRSATEPVLPYFPPNFDDRARMSDGARHTITGLGLDRGAFQRAGTSGMKGLLKDLKAFDEFAKTDTAAAMQEYSSRSRSKHKSLPAGQEALSQVQQSPWSPSAPRAAPVQRASVDALGKQDKALLEEKINIWARKKSSDKLASHDSSWQDETREGSTQHSSKRSSRQSSNVALQSATSQRELGDGIDASCTSILPCAIVS